MERRDGAEAEEQEQEEKKNAQTIDGSLELAKPSFTNTSPLSPLSIFCNIHS